MPPPSGFSIPPGRRPRLSLLAARRAGWRRNFSVCSTTAAFAPGRPRPCVLLIPVSQDQDGHIVILFSAFAELPDSRKQAVQEKGCLQPQVGRNAGGDPIVAEWLALAVG